MDFIYFRTSKPITEQTIKNKFKDPNIILTVYAEDIIGNTTNRIFALRASTGIVSGYEEFGRWGFGTFSNIIRTSSSKDITTKPIKYNKELL